MRYKIVCSFPKLETAKKIYTLLVNSKVYNSSEIMSLSKITEVCDECSK